MTLDPVYDSIGDGYRDLRIPDPRIAARIRAALGDAKTVCNVGAGAGSYEPLDLAVTAVEPSQTMIAQRNSAADVVCCTAEKLPFGDKSFDASMAVLTVHHWKQPLAGLSEMCRISRRQVVFTFDPEKSDLLWLVRDYLPEIVEFEKQRAISIETISDALHANAVEVVEIPFDCSDGFQGAYWRRPAAYLSRDVRQAISTLAQLPRETVSHAIERLASDLESGEWNRRYADLLNRESLDLGYRLVVGGEL